MVAERAHGQGGVTLLGQAGIGHRARIGQDAQCGTAGKGVDDVGVAVLPEREAPDRIVIVLQ